MSAHTPGPEFNLYDDGDILDGNGALVAHVHQPSFRSLIAAAPEMLDQLHRAYTAILNAGDHLPGDSDADILCADVLSTIRDLITRIEGKE